MVSNVRGHWPQSRCRGVDGGLAVSHRIRRKTKSSGIPAIRPIPKLLTGRREQFHTLRQYGGLSRFCKRESACDTFNAGHATGISAAFGMVEAREQQGENKVVCVVGDGAMTRV